MSSKTQTDKKTSDFGAVGKILEAFAMSFWGYLKVCGTGIKRIKLKSWDTTIVLMFFILLSTYLAKQMIHIKAFYYLFDGYWGTFFTKTLIGIPKFYHGLGLFFCFSTATLFFMGAANFFRNRKFQSSLDELGISSSKGTKPQVLESIIVDDNKTKLVISSRAVGIEKWESKKSDLSAAFGEIVNEIKQSPNKKNVHITLSKRELPTLCHYLEMKEVLKKPYSFVVGKSLKGIITQQITELPHMLIAGTTGGGKSVYFNNVILGLLHSSKKIKMYLLDLKMGVETQQYEDFPNIKIAKDEQEALGVLQDLNKEMYRRFAFMKEKGIKKIDPIKHKKDIIICAVDEASVLYGIERSGDKEKKQSIQKARDLTHNLAKLARACGIHLIIATQKVSKEIIDTNVQANTQGKMCFKVSTIASSSTVLGNKMAFDLPSVKGRAIWANGNEYTEIQAPFISEEEINEECLSLKEKFKSSGCKNEGSKPSNKAKIQNDSDVNVEEAPKLDHSPIP